MYTQYSVLYGHLEFAVQVWLKKHTIPTKMGKKEKRDQRYRESMKETDPVVEDSKYGREHWCLRQFFCSFDRIITILSNQLIGNPLPCAFGRHWFYQLDPCSFYFLETIFSIEYIYIYTEKCDWYTNCFFHSIWSNISKSSFYVIMYYHIAKLIYFGSS